MAGYLDLAASELGISVVLLVVIAIWSMVWKLLGLWKAARKGSVVWFVVLALINTVGILPMLYIFVFSHMRKPKPVEKAKPKRKAPKTNTLKPPPWLSRTL